jgi:hypothetical protein
MKGPIASFYYLQDLSYFCILAQTPLEQELSLSELAEIALVRW